MKTSVMVLVVTVGSPAFADPAPEEVAALRSSVGWGQTVAPDRASLSTEAGYDGARQLADATGHLEVTLIPRLSVFAAVTYGEETAGASRPALGAAFQITDPRTTWLGARISTAYKPEGFSEPEGEIETILVLSHLLSTDVARTFVAYGRDPDGHESDVELGLGYLHPLTDAWLVGLTSRGRYAIQLKDVGPRWDLIAGAVGDFVVNQWRFEVLVGGGAVDTSGVSTGLIALGSAGIDL
jgi:hypothetical protein